MDSGADCSLITERAYLKLKQLYKLSFLPETRTFNAVQGSPLNVIGSVILPMSFHAHDVTFPVTFHIVTDFALKCDALLGFDELARHDISLHPRYQAFSHKGAMYYAPDNPTSVLSVTSRRAHFEQSPLPRVETACPVSHGDSASVSDNVESKRSISTDLCAATVIGDQYIGPTCAHRVPVRVSQAPVGSCVVSHPDSIRVQRLAFEGTLSTVRDAHVTEALVTNLSGCSVTLKDGVHLGSFSIIDEKSFREAPPLIAAVSEQHASCSPADLITQLETHVRVVDYPDERSRLNDLLMTHGLAHALSMYPLTGCLIPSVKLLKI